MGLFYEIRSPVQVSDSPALHDVFYRPSRYVRLTEHFLVTQSPFLPFVSQIEISYLTVVGRCVSVRRLILVGRY